MLRLCASDPRLEPHISLNPSRAAIVEFVTAALEALLHGSRDPELHRPAHESPIESLGSDPNDGVRDIIEALRLANDFRVPFETLSPQLIADHYDRMGVAAYLLARFETTPQNRTNADRVEVVG